MTAIPVKKKAKDRDGVYKRREHWHFDYKDPVTGQWRSKSTGRTVYNQAKEFRRQFIESLKGEYNPDNDRLKFTAAADAYIEHRKVSASEGTVQLERERLKAAKSLLAKLGHIDLRLREIDLKLLRLYQARRIAEGVGPRTVNMEGQLLRSILKHYEQWKLEGKYKPLPEPPSEAGRSLTPAEEIRLLDAAQARPERFVAYHATVLENETGMRGVEVRNLQLKRIDLEAANVHLLRSKTKGGIRTIALSLDAMNSLRALMDRAEKLGGTAPDHYLIPARVMVKDGSGKTRQSHDPTRPTKGWRTAWRKLTIAAGLRGLRGHDLRHNWVTSHAELGTPQSVLEAQAGHLSKQMSDRYKHISEGAARKAADELARAKHKAREEARTAMSDSQTSAESTMVN